MLSRIYAVKLESGYRCWISNELESLDCDQLWKSQW
jgi:hypothetical protein